MVSVEKSYHRETTRHFRYKHITSKQLMDQGPDFSGSSAPMSVPFHIN